MTTLDQNDFMGPFSEETTEDDHEGVWYECYGVGINYPEDSIEYEQGCNWEGYLIPIAIDGNGDEAEVTCPRCFETGYAVIWEA